MPNPILTLTLTLLNIQPMQHCDWIIWSFIQKYNLQTHENTIISLSTRSSGPPPLTIIPLLCSLPSRLSHLWTNMLSCTIVVQFHYTINSNTQCCYSQHTKPYHILAFSTILFNITITLSAGTHLADVRALSSNTQTEVCIHSNTPFSHIHKPVNNVLLNS